MIDSYIIQIGYFWRLLQFHKANCIGNVFLIHVGLTNCSVFEYHKFFGLYNCSPNWIINKIKLIFIIKLIDYEKMNLSFLWSKMMKYFLKIFLVENMNAIEIERRSNDHIYINLAFICFLKCLHFIILWDLWKLQN